MSTFVRLRKGGKLAGDAILTPGDPEGSYLIESIRGVTARRMPLKQPRLSEAEVTTLTQWIQQGARFDGPSEERTTLASLVDPLRGLPEIALKVKPSEPVRAVAFQPAGKIVAAGMGRRVVLFDVATGKSTVDLGEHPGPISSLVFASDGQTLIAAGGRAGMFGSVTIWDLASGKRKAEMRGHDDAILSAAISPDGSMMATGGYDRIVLIWDLAHGSVVQTLKGHTDAVHGVTFSPDGKRLASCAADRTVKLWDWKSGRRLATLSESTAELYSVAFTPDGSLLLAAGADRSIRTWRIDGDRITLDRSIMAHERAIVRLVLSKDGKNLATSGEDRRVKVWGLPGLDPRLTLPIQTDWVQGLAFSPDSRALAVGRFDGSLDLVDAGTGKPGLALRAGREAHPAAKAELVRNASLDPPSPRGGMRGSRMRLTLTGTGIGRAISVSFREPGLKATLVPSEKPDPNRSLVDLEIAPTARVGVHSFIVVTPLGIPPAQSFAVSSTADVTEQEAGSSNRGAGQRVVLPATLVGTIDPPGDVDQFEFDAGGGEDLVFEDVSRSLGSSLETELRMLDSKGRLLDGTMIDHGDLTPVVVFRVPEAGRCTLRIGDVNYGGAGGRFYRINAGRSSVVRSVFPLGVVPGETAHLSVAGFNLKGSTETSFPVGRELPVGTIVPVPFTPRDESQSRPRSSVVVAEGPQLIEQEHSADSKAVQLIAVPGGVSGRISDEHDRDVYRFRATKGDRIILETFARRLGSPIDTVIEVLDSSEKPVPRASLRTLDQTEIAFRDHGSLGPGIRLTRWNNLAINDYVLMGREVAKILALPRNPDDDCKFWSERGQRLGMLETTPEQHPVGQAMYRVEILPPGGASSPGGVAPVILNYRNDDGGPTYSKDSRLTFDAPEDGEYLVKVADVRGMGGDDFAYHLVVRRPRPDFVIAVNTENPNIPRGGTTLVAVSLTRIDGFDGMVKVSAEALPPGVRSTPAIIEPGHYEGLLSLTADEHAPAFSPPLWRLVATSSGSKAEGRECARHSKRDRPRRPSLGVDHGDAPAQFAG